MKYWRLDPRLLEATSIRQLRSIASKRLLDPTLQSASISPVRTAIATASTRVRTRSFAQVFSRWMEKRGNVSAIYEQVFVQEEGWAMTPLLVDENEEDGEGNGLERNRRSSRCTF